MNPAEPIAGRVVRERYRIDFIVGSGRMADVYKALDLVLERPVAVKVLTGGDAPTRTRFVAEARAMALLNHPNITAIYDFGEIDSYSYIVMEYVEGGTLAELHPDHVSFSRLHAIFTQILEALEYAHKRRVIHRDLKPGNILIGEKDLIKIVDFGLSRRISDVTQTTTPGTIIGTVSYLPPEIFLGKPSDQRGDLYSVGIMLYQAFTGRLPFRTASDDVIALVYAHVNEIPVSPRAINSDIPPALDELILRLLAKDPADRFDSATDVLTDFARIHLSDIRAREHVHPPALDVVVEPEARRLVDTMLSPRRSQKAAFGSVLTAMLAVRRRNFKEAAALYRAALADFDTFGNDAEYIKTSIALAECVTAWIRYSIEAVDESTLTATAKALRETKQRAALRNQSREVHAAQELLTSFGFSDFPGGPHA